MAGMADEVDEEAAGGEEWRSFLTGVAPVAADDDDESEEEGGELVGAAQGTPVETKTPAAGGPIPQKDGDAAGVEEDEDDDEDDEEDAVAGDEVDESLVVAEAAEAGAEVEAADDGTAGTEVGGAWVGDCEISSEEDEDVAEEAAGEEVDASFLLTEAAQAEATPSASSTSRPANAAPEGKAGKASTGKTGANKVPGKGKAGASVGAGSLVAGSAAAASKGKAGKGKTFLLDGKGKAATAVGKSNAMAAGLGKASIAAAGKGKAFLQSGKAAVGTAAAGKGKAFIAKGNAAAAAGKGKAAVATEKAKGKGKAGAFHPMALKLGLVKKQAGDAAKPAPRPVSVKKQKKQQLEDWDDEWAEDSAPPKKKAKTKAVEPVAEVWGEEAQDAPKKEKKRKADDLSNSYLGTDKEGRAYDLKTVVVNLANVGASFGKKVLKREGQGLFDWDGIRRCVKVLKKEKKFDVVGVINENYTATDSGSRQRRDMPPDIKKLFASIEETPRIDGQRHSSADDEMTIKCAYRRNCRFLDNDNYRDWVSQLRDDKIRKWLKGSQEFLQMRYYFDSGLGTFELIEGNIPDYILAPEKGKKTKEVTKQQLWHLANDSTKSKEEVWW